MSYIYTMQMCLAILVKIENKVKKKRRKNTKGENEVNLRKLLLESNRFDFKS